MFGELQRDGMATLVLRVKSEQIEAFKEIARREEIDPVGVVVRIALGSFLIQYAEAHPPFKDFLHDIALRSLLGDTAVNYLELIPKPEDPTSQE